MNCCRLIALVAVLAAICVGCVPQTQVTLDNDTDATVDVTVHYHDDQNVLEDLIDDVGARLDFTLGPGEAVTFSRDCEDLQAIQVEADLQLIGGLGPSQTSDVFRDGSDFGCADRIRFTFAATALPPDLDINFANF